MPLIDSHELRGLAVSSLKRSDVLPDIPTTLEAGYPNSDYVFWIGLFAPAATPRDIIQRLHDAAAKALDDKTVGDNLRKLGAAPMTMTPPRSTPTSKPRSQPSPPWSRRRGSHRIDHIAGSSRAIIAKRCRPKPP